MLCSRSSASASDSRETPAKPCVADGTALIHVKQPGRNAAGNLDVVSRETEW